MPVKIRLNTWDRCSNKATKFKRGIAPREGFVEYCTKTKKIFLKEGNKKWKNWDTSIPRGQDQSYIDEKKELYSGLCFETKKDAQKFMEKHKDELDKLAASNPLFTNWSIMNVIKRFEAKTKLVYGKDIKDD